LEFTPTCHEKIRSLIHKGVSVLNPSTIDIGDEVKLEHISGNSVTIYPGCRIYGNQTVISSGAQIGKEGPVTIEDCQLGEDVELKGGFFRRSVFLKQSCMGLGAHVREGCILEEQANGAHCVGLKQTVLFPFVTLGSLINFCDCLMSGGTSRAHHSEVGSSYIHFNYTPESDKTTPSLLGDVPRGVMLNQAPIFLGGQGGIVGPIRLGFGNVVGAGTILRKDSPEDGKLIFGKSYRESVIDFVPRLYPDISRMVSNNIIFIANLTALEHWYQYVRKGLMSRAELGNLVYLGALDKLALAKTERQKRLRAMAEKMPDSLDITTRNHRSATTKHEFHHHIDDICAVFSDTATAVSVKPLKDRFLTELNSHIQHTRHSDYLQIIQTLPPQVSLLGTKWLQSIIDDICCKTSVIVPDMNLFT